MRKPLIFTLDEYLNLIIKLPFEENSKRFLLQQTIEYTLKLVDILCLCSNVDGNKIKGVLFSVKYYESNLETNKHSVILITDLSYSEFRSNVNRLHLIDTIKEDDPELEKLIKDENCILIYGNYDLAMKVGTSRLPQPFLANYKE